MKYIILLVLVLAVSAKKAKQEFNASKILNGGAFDMQECKHLYQYGFNYLVGYCNGITHPKKDETFCMMLASSKGADYNTYGNEVCNEFYTCENYNDDSVLFMIERVFGERLPAFNGQMQSGRGMHYWFTEATGLMTKLTNDKCQSLVASLR